MEQQRNIYVAGNYIAEQHIETQILHADNVYNHAPQQFRTHLPLIDVEDVMPSAKSTTARPSKRPNAHHFLETRTFIYRYNNARPEDSRMQKMQYAYILFYPLMYLCGLANNMTEVAHSMLACSRDGYSQFVINPRDITKLARQI